MNVITHYAMDHYEGSALGTEGDSLMMAHGMWRNMLETC
jgi:hypothetical protein